MKILASKRFTSKGIFRDIILILCLVLVGMISGCSSSSKMSNTNNEAETILMSSDTLYYAEVQKEELPLYLSTDLAVFEKASEILLNPYNPDKYQSPQEGLNDTDLSVITINGFRVQVFSGIDGDRARRLKEELENKIESPVFLEFEAPQYKVRVGSFRLRSEANEHCQILRTEGYRDAWVVPVTWREEP